MQYAKNQVFKSHPLSCFIQQANNETPGQQSKQDKDDEEEEPGNDNSSNGQ